MKNIISLMIILVAVSCGNKTKTEDTIKIGLSANSFSDQWATYVFNTIEKVSKEYPNVELTILDAKDDSATQLSQVENLITTGHDAIILYAVDRASIGNIGRLAKEAGVLVTAVNRAPEPQHVQYIDLYTGIDEKKAGEAVGKQFLTDLEKQGRLNENIEVAILQGIIGQEATIARSEGFKEIIAP
ncbi:MAG: substrate-binding domain-containing protein, partial [Brevinema sp.]